MHFPSALASITLVLHTACSLPATRRSADAPPGRFVDLGGWSQYVHCTGRGSPTIVIEAGLGDFGSDWIRVQELASPNTRICAYDRAGYGFSDAGPMPRTYAQINTDLHRLLRAAGERGPFMLVGHSFGGPVVRHYARLFPDDVAGIVLLDATHENQRIYYGGAPHRLREGAQPGRVAPPPQTHLKPTIAMTARFGVGDPEQVDALYASLTRQERSWRAWAESRHALNDARTSETTWSPDYLQAMFDNPSAWTLGDIPLLVITRRQGGYVDRSGAPAAEMEAERMSQQAALARLSTRSRHLIADMEHNPNLSDPAWTARTLVGFAEEVRRRR